MRRKTFFYILSCEAVLCMVLYLAHVSIAEGVVTAIAFPFEQLGLCLRSLSLSGSIGNAISIIIYTALCLAPLLILAVIRKKRKLYMEDTLLAILSAVLFLVLYMMINPHMLTGYMGDSEGLPIVKAVLGEITYSVLIGYVALRLIRVLYAADAAKVQKYLTVLLYALNILFVYVAFGSCFGTLINAMETLKAGNTGNTQYLGTSYLFLILQYIVNALPYVMDVVIVTALLNLVDKFNISRYSEAAVLAAEKITHICRRALVATILSSVLFNVLQLVFIKSLYVIHSSIQIPLVPVVFMIAALLLAQYIRETKQLKDDNNMFI